MAARRAGGIARPIGAGIMPKVTRSGATPLRSPSAPRVPGTTPSPWAPPNGYVFPQADVGLAAAAAQGPAAPAAPRRDPATDLSWQDSGFNSTVANLLEQKQRGKAALAAAGRRAAEDRDRNVSLLGEGRGKARTAATQSANRSGLFYSGKLGKDLGDADTDYGRRTEGVNTAYTRGEQDRTVQDQGLDAAFGQAQQTAAQQAIDRWINGAVAAEQASTPSLEALIAALSNLNTNGRR